MREPYPRGLKQMSYPQLTPPSGREPYPRGLKLESGDRPFVPPEARTLSTGIETGTLPPSEHLFQCARTLSTGIETNKPNRLSEEKSPREPYPRGLKPGPRPLFFLAHLCARTLSTGIETLPLTRFREVDKRARTLSTGIETLYGVIGLAYDLLGANLIHGD